MSETPQLILYTLDCCPHCELLKSYLTQKGAAYTEEDLSSAASLTELRLNGVFVNEAPVLRKEDTFLTTTELFSAGKVNAANVDSFLSGA